MKRKAKTKHTENAPAFSRDARPRANTYGAAIGNLFEAVGNDREQRAALTAMIRRVAVRRLAALHV